MQKWKATSFGMPNIARKRSITVAWSVVGSEPMPRAWAASMRFWQAGMIELAPPGGTVSAKTTQGTSFIASASPMAAL